jgi:hypothetical protein
MQALKGEYLKMEKTQEKDYKRDGYPRRPSTFRDQRSFNQCEGNNKIK